MGAPFIVIPSSYHVIEATSDDADQSDVNAQRVLKAPLPLWNSI